MKLQEYLKLKLPQKPGVYRFLGARGEVFYIGKATSLRERVRSYFSKDLSLMRGAQIVSMVEQAKKVDCEPTDSVLEALLLEASLIRKWKPKYNTREKDDKSFNCVVITDEPFPRVLVIRKREIDFDGLKTPGYKIKTIFGPFPNGGALRDAMKLVRKIFPFRDKCKPMIQSSGLSNKPCFERQIGLCPGVCTGEISGIDYRKHIKLLRMFFEGKKKALLSEIKKDMKRSAKEQKFEEAGRLKRMLFSLTHIHDIALIKKDMSLSPYDKTFRIEAYDIAHISGKQMVGVMTVIEDGEAKKSDYRKFKIRGFLDAHDTGALKEVLERRFNHPEWKFPDLIVLDGGRAQLNAGRSVAREFGINALLVSVVKDEKHRGREILGEPGAWRGREREIYLANNEAHRFAIKFHRELRDKNFTKK
jgi:excinuclease ABC subunit C